MLEKLSNCYYILILHVTDTFWNSKIQRYKNTFYETVHVDIIVNTIVKLHGFAYRSALVA